MIVRVTIESDSGEDGLYYDLDVSPEEFEDIKANIDVMMENYDGSDIPLYPEDEGDVEDILVKEEEPIDEADRSSDPPTDLTDPRD